MATVNSVQSARLPLPAFSPRAVLMYSAALGGEGAVALQLREAPGAEPRALAIACHDPDLLHDLLHAANDIGNESGSGAGLGDLLEAASPGADLALGSDASDSLGLSDHDSDVAKTVTICSGSALAASAPTGAADKAPLSAKKVRPKAASPNRQGPQQCQVCNKVFGNASALAKHKLTHSDERKYVCGMCAKAFKRQDHLNGHMLTHRNKKPYECKADGCGKSYCDARSLRRHTENHHHSADAPPSGASSPTSGCIRYATSAPGSPSRAATAATETESCSSASSPSSPPQKAGAARTTTARPAHLHKAPRSWTLQVQQGQHKTSISSPPSTSSTVTSFGSSGKPLEQKPVECNLCHRKFKNIPALNGHMRLHGGYFKKDTDSKKFEKKETSGPPLQTASVSVRALIEEKIISRRGTQPSAVVKAPSAATTSSSESTKPTTSTSSASSSSGTTSTSSTVSASGTSSSASRAAFVAPAPPPLAPAPTRRADFRAPAATALAAHQKDSTLIELLKRGTKVAVKRSASDPGHQSPQPVQLSFQPAEFAFGVSFQSDDGGYFSPTLQDEVYQVQDSTILLQQNSSDSLQFTSTTDQLDDLTSLEDYATVTASLQDQPTINYSTNQQLQAVLNSPLPESLADFSTYHSTVVDSPSAKDVLGFQKEYVMYANSPHVGLSAPSPLPSPLKYHDSPSFTYPTPPASHEAQSPSISQGPIQSLPLLSPQGSVQTRDSFVDPISHSTDVDEVRNTSSPLSAAFFTTTMSSAEEVEEALEEVLPGESIVHGDTLDMYSLSNPSPPPQSPICVTPLPSPLSGQPAVSVASPSHTFVPTTNLSFSVQTLQALQSQMMPNSEDPLLSSSPKDFGSKKKFDFGGYQSYKIISHGPIDLHNPNVTGILVEANGEFKLIQTSTNQLPVSWLSGTPNQIISKDQNLVLQTQYSTKPGSAKTNFGNQIQISQEEPMQTDAPLVTTQSSVPGLKVEVDPIKQEAVSDVFLSPSSIPASPQRAPRKRPRCEPFESIIQGPFQSRLRSAQSTTYTPSPILNPIRSGSGLYSDLYLSGSLASPISAVDLTSPVEEKRTPRINVGSQYQAVIPEMNSDEVKLDRDSNCEQLMWDPGINDTLDDNEVRMFMELAMCAAMPVGGHSREHALAVLRQCAGDVQAATLRLMRRDAAPDPRADSQRWTPDEVESFLLGLREHDKDFFRIAKQVGTKSSKQCVQFYYFWKKVTKDYKSLFLRSWSPERGGDRCSAQGSWGRSWGTSRSRSSCTPSPTPAFDGDEFPCKICGKVFNKVKSRSAHMKSHRPLDTDPKRSKMDKTLDKMSDEKPQPSPEYHSKTTQP